MSEKPPIRYDTVFATVDVAIFDGNRSHVLLGRKPNKTLFRFIGGFADVKSRSFEDDARREVKEETNLDIQDLEYIGSTLIDDWRYRESRDKIKTLFFIASIKGDTLPKASDDIEEVRFFNVDLLEKSDIVEEHHVLLDMLKDKIK